MQREQIECDVVIVGAGPAGLAAAIKLKQLNEKLEVCVVEKAVEVGAHILSGNCFEPRALDELIPEWRSLDVPVKTPVTRDQISLLTESSSFTVPQVLVPRPLKNTGNFVISLGDLVKWLGAHAESLGVQIYPGFAASDFLLSSEGSIEGVVTGDFGLSRTGQQKESFQPGVELRAKQTVLAEGCRGSLSQRLITQFNLQAHRPQAYGLGVKEVWKIKPERFESGLVLHTLGWPLDYRTAGGGFLYHQGPDLVHVGLITGLNYRNPYLSPFKEFQRYKTHPLIRKYLEGAECIAYGARALNEGSLYSVPKLTFPGGMLVGCAAGFMNTAKIKGSHTALKTGMLAAEAVAEAFARGDPAGQELSKYSELYRNSWVWEELYEVRNFREGFEKNIWWGQVQAFLSYNFFRGNRVGLGTAKHVDDSKATELAKDSKAIEYPKADGKLTFDLLTSVARTNTDHETDQPSHLKVKPGMEDKPEGYSLKLFGGPEQRFCPAGVYEFVENKLVINAQNCIHCKTCDIKTPSEYILWTTPEGGGGPY